MISRILAGATVAWLLLAGVEIPASASCSTDCHTDHYQFEICTTCCRTCYNSRGEITYSGCDERCVWL